MIDLSKLSESELRNAIWDVNCGRIPLGGLDIKEFREELRRRGLDDKGYHEE